MREPAEIVTALPRPGRALAAVLALLTSVAISGALVAHWSDQNAELASWLAFRPTDRVHLFDRPWTLLTSGLLTSPHGLGHLLTVLVGLYFFGTEVEKRWGGGRVLRFILASIVFGNLAVLAGTLVPLEKGFHPDLALGPFAAVAALAIVWAKDNWDRNTRLFSSSR